jgi:hypothetical protein
MYIGSYIDSYIHTQTNIDKEVYEYMENTWQQGEEH